jgi:hypothetical protein
MAHTSFPFQQLALPTNMPVVLVGGWNPSSNVIEVSAEEGRVKKNYFECLPATLIIIIVAATHSFVLGAVGGKVLNLKKFSKQVCIWQVYKQK